MSNPEGKSRSELEKQGYSVGYDGRLKNPWGHDVKSTYGQTYNMQDGVAKKDSWWGNSDRK